MDPVSQGVLGAVTSMAFAKREDSRKAVLIGWGAGMLADADIFIRSSSDPLLNVEYHRHFSHSLIFIPIGGLIAAAVFWLSFRKSLGFRKVFKYSILGYATAGLLDACTSYGTQLLWPFSGLRVAWNIISIIDPVFTVPLLGLAAVGCLRRKPVFGKVGIAWAIGYLLFGSIQNFRASELQAELIAERGQSSEAYMTTVKPSIANLWLWRSIYRVEDQFFVDAVRVGYLGGRTIIKGDVVEAENLEDLLAKAPADSALEEDLRRFDHFSDGYLIWHPSKENMLCDLRYAFLPNSIEPLWGIRVLFESPDTHADFVNFRELNEETRSAYADMLWDSGNSDTD